MALLLPACPLVPSSLQRASGLPPRRLLFILHSLLSLCPELFLYLFRETIPLYLPGSRLLLYQQPGRVDYSFRGKMKRVTLIKAGSQHGRTGLFLCLSPEINCSSFVPRINYHLFKSSSRSSVVTGNDCLLVPRTIINPQQRPLWGSTIDNQKSSIQNPLAPPSHACYNPSDL
jgi:hypothetical protein